MSLAAVLSGLRNVPLTLGLLGLAVIATVAVLGQQLAPHDPHAERWILFAPPEAEVPYRFPPTAPDTTYWLGTDGLGRDLLSRFLTGAQLTFAVVGTALACRMLVGIAVGAAAGWSKGPVGMTLRQLIGSVSAVPQLLVVVVLVLLLRDGGVMGFALALALVGWGEIASFTADRVRALRSAAHVEAAVSLGASSPRIVRDHVLRVLAPSLLTLAALEAGAVLLLLAELGVLGLFVAGASYYVDEDTGLTILPLRDRAPEWGQMLAGLRAYGNEQRYIVLIPAIVVAGAVLAFNLLGEGLRIANDPRSPARLSARGQRTLMRVTGLGLAALVAALAATSLARPTLDLETGMALAIESARKVSPDNELVAAVARFRSDAGALATPEKLNYYFYDRPAARSLRVGFVDGRPEAVEVRPYQMEDELDVLRLNPLDVDASNWETAMTKSQAQTGTLFRIRYPNYIVRVIVRWHVGEDTPRYEVVYKSGPSVVRHCCFDLKTGELLPGTDDH